MRTISTAAILLLAACGPSFAQGIENAAARQRDGRWRIEVSFLSSFTQASDQDLATNPDNFIVLDVVRVQRIAVERVEITDVSVVDLILATNVSLDVSSPYHIYARNLTFGGIPPKPTKDLNAAVRVLKPGAQPASEPKRFSWETEQADSRSKADIYIAGQLFRASGTKTAGAADIKIGFPIYPDPNNGYYKLTPLFDLKWSSDPKADPDTLMLGIESKFMIGERLDWKSFWGNVILTNTPKVESDRSFENTNTLLQTRLVLPTPPLPEGLPILLRSISFEPTLGLELGKNINSPVDEANHRTIARPLVGVDMISPLYEASSGLIEKITLEGSWQKRWPLTPEVYFKVGDDQQVSPTRFGTNPKDYVTGKANFALRKLFSVYVGYEYGSLPPKYKFVEQKVTLGFQYSVAFKKP